MIEKMNNDGASSSSATDVAMFLYSFKDLIPLILHQWYLYHINKVIRLGLLEPYPWIITQISTTEFQNNFSFSAEKQKKKSKKGESATLATSTRVLLSFAHYRVVICLDISESSFSSTSILTDTLLSILFEISANTRSNKRIIGVQLSIIAHMPDIDETWSIWQGEVTSESDIHLLQTIVLSRIERIEEESLKSKINALQNPTRSTFCRFPDSETFLKAILFHLRLLPGEACPKAILLTSGSMTINTSSTALINEFSKNLISLKVLVEQVPCDRPIGFHSDICGLSLIAEQTVGGSIEILHNISMASVTDVCQRLIGPYFFNYLAFGCQKDLPGMERNLNNQFSTATSVQRRTSMSLGLPDDSASTNRQETHIRNYPCEGSTVEHLLSVRHSEGFKIIDVVFERENTLSVHATQSGPISNPVLSRGVSLPLKKQPFLTFARQHAQQHQPIIYLIVIRMEKRVSKLFSIVYQISYRKDYQTNRLSNSLVPTRPKAYVEAKNTISQTYGHTSVGVFSKGAQMQGSKMHVKQSWQKAIAGEAVSPEELAKLFDEIRYGQFLLSSRMILYIVSLMVSKHACHRMIVAKISRGPKGLSVSA